MNGPDGKRFVWGRIKETHEVGPYAIVEFEPSNWNTKNPPAREFHPYVNGKDTSTSALTLDGALCLAIAFRSGNVSAGTYMMKLVQP